MSATGPWVPPTAAPVRPAGPALTAPALRAPGPRSQKSWAGISQVFRSLANDGLDERLPGIGSDLLSVGPSSLSVEEYMQRVEMAAAEAAGGSGDAFEVSATYVGPHLKWVEQEDILGAVVAAVPRLDVRSRLSRRGGFGGMILLFAERDEVERLSQGGGPGAAAGPGRGGGPTPGERAGGRGGGGPRDAGPEEGLAPGDSAGVEAMFRSPEVHPRGVVVFDFGAVVCLGLGRDAEAHILRELSLLELSAKLSSQRGLKYEGGEGREGPGGARVPYVSRAENENFVVEVRPTQHSFSVLRGNTLSLQTIDVDSVRVIATALAQSVAMDHYSRLTDSMMDEFERMSSGLQRAKGRFNVSKKKLFKLVAQTNLVMIDVVRNIGVMERSEPAWENVRYDQLWDIVRKDLELIDRFKTLRTKVQMIQDSSKVYLDIMNNRRSDMLEIMIVVLISIEIVVMLLQISVDSGILDSASLTSPGQTLHRLVVQPLLESAGVAQAPGGAGGEGQPGY